MKKYQKKGLDEMDSMFGGGKKGKKNKEFQEFIDISDMDMSVFQSIDFDLIPHYEQDNKNINQDTILILKKIAAQYKHVLTLEFRQFWATVKCSFHLKRSLDAFLSYSLKKKYNAYFYSDNVPENYDYKEYNNLVQQSDQLLVEITRMAFLIYLRIIFRSEENSSLSNAFKLSQLIYDEWIIDLPKMLDLIDIYGGNNKEIVQQMVQTCFQNNKNYKEDLLMTFENFANDNQIFSQIYKKLIQISRKDDMDVILTDEDLIYKMETLTQLLDSLNCVQNIINFMHNYLDQDIHFSMNIIQYYEQIFYEIVLARSKWILGSYRNNFTPVMDRILEFIVQYFKVMFTKLFEAFSGAKNSKQADLAKKITGKVVKDFGKIQSLGKKGQSNDKRMWMIIEHISDEFDFETFFQIAPQKYDGVTTDDLMMFQVKIVSVCEERRKQISQYQENQKNGSNKKLKKNNQDEKNEDDNDNDSNYSFEFDDDKQDDGSQENKLSEIELQKKLEEDAKKRLEEQKKKMQDYEQLQEKKKGILEMLKNNSSMRKKSSMDDQYQENEQFEAYKKQAKLEYDDDFDEQDQEFTFKIGGDENEDEQESRTKEKLAELSDNEEKKHSKNKKQQNQDSDDSWDEFQRKRDEERKLRQKKRSDDIKHSVRDQGYEIKVNKNKKEKQQKKQEIKAEVKIPLKKENQEQQQPDKNDQKQQQNETKDQQNPEKSKKQNQKQKEQKEKEKEEKDVKKKPTQQEKPEKEANKHVKIGVNRDLQKGFQETEWDAEIIVDDREYDPIKDEEYRKRFLIEEKTEKKKTRTRTPTPSSSDTSDYEEQGSISGYTDSSSDKFTESDEENAYGKNSQSSEQYSEDEDEDEDKKEEFKERKRFNNQFAKHGNAKKAYAQDRNRQNYYDRKEYEKNKEEYSDEDESDQKNKNQYDNKNKYQKAFKNMRQALDKNHTKNMYEDDYIEPTQKQEAQGGKKNYKPRDEKKYYNKQEKIHKESMEAYDMGSSGDEKEYIPKQERQRQQQQKQQYKQNQQPQKNNKDDNDNDNQSVRSHQSRNRDNENNKSNNYRGGYKGGNRGRGGYSRNYENRDKYQNNERRNYNNRRGENQDYDNNNNQDQKDYKNYKNNDAQNSNNNRYKPRDNYKDNRQNRDQDRQGENNNNNQNYNSNNNRYKPRDNYRDNRRDNDNENNDNNNYRKYNDNNDGDRRDNDRGGYRGGRGNYRGGNRGGRGNNRGGNRGGPRN